MISKDGVTILAPSRTFYRVVYGLYLSRLAQWEWEINRLTWNYHKSLTTIKSSKFVIRNDIQSGYFIL